MYKISNNGPHLSSEERKCVILSVLFRAIKSESICSTTILLNRTQKLCKTDIVEILFNFFFKLLNVLYVGVLQIFTTQT